MLVLRILESLDQFGVTFQPSIKYSKTQYKTWLGGVISILLYGLSCCYLVYLFAQWRSGQMLPKITTASKLQQNQALTLNETYVQFEIRKFEYTTIDPFNPQQLILQPVVYYFKNGAPMLPPLPIQYSVNKNSEGFQVVNISNLALSISEIKNENEPELEMILTLGACQTPFLFEGQQCADNDTIDQYFSQPTNIMKLRQFAKEFNTETGTLEIISRESMIFVRKTDTFVLQTFVRVSQTDVDTGILFQSVDSYNYITDYRGSSSILDLTYFSSIMHYNFYAAIYYKLDNLQLQQTILYPKLSEVLAEAGSIASTLFLLSYLVVILNQKQLQCEAIHNVISMYYPGFKNIKMQKNFLGKITKVEKDGKLLDLKAFLASYQRLSKVGETKLSISNQIYEISRLQFVMQSIYTSKFITQFHHQGIPYQPVFMAPSSDSEQNTMKLDNSIHPDNQKQIVNIDMRIQFPISLNEQMNDTNILQTTQPKFHQRNERSEKVLVISSQDSRNNIVQINSQDNLFRDSDFELLIIQEDQKNEKDFIDNNNNNFNEQLS